MKFGVNILNFGPDASPETLSGWARMAEDLGFHIAMMSDHVTVTPDVAEQYPAPFYDPLTALGWLAGTTSRIELGTTVTIVPYRHPLQTARVVANLDRLSGGRFVFGVSVGWARQEFEALGVPFERRGVMTDEYLAAIREHWSKDVFSFEGEFASFKDVATAPRPERVRVWVGAQLVPAGLRRTVRYGDAWHPINMPVAVFRDKGLPALRAVAEELERPMPALAPRIKMRITSSRLPEQDRRPGEGTLAQVRGDLEVLADLGVEYVVFDSYLGAPDPWEPAEEHWRRFETLAGQLIDTERETLR
jgi:probable F420-dependent oxidoreductase